MYDVLVIGNGLIGSAAAKYLSGTDLKVAIAGPRNPRIGHRIPACLPATTTKAASPGCLTPIRSGRSWDAGQFTPIWRLSVRAACSSSIHTKPCVLTYTSTNRPYLDTVVPKRLFVATGGCGLSAKSSDAIGNLAAQLTHRGGWEVPEGSLLRPEAFRIPQVSETRAA